MTPNPAQIADGKRIHLGVRVSEVCEVELKRIAAETGLSCGAVVDVFVRGWFADGGPGRKPPAR